MQRLVLGINGFIGSGKTYVARFFERKGAFLIDADQVVNELYQYNRDGYLQIKNYFGEQFVTAQGQVNKKKLAKFVFADPKKLKILHYIIHPLVANEVQKILDATDAALIVLEATFFEEKYLLRFVDTLLWVDTDLELCKKRVMTQGKFTEKLLDQIMLAQKKYLIRPSKIDFTIDNNGSFEELNQQLEDIWKLVAN